MHRKISKDFFGFDIHFCRHEKLINDIDNKLYNAEVLILIITLIYRLLSTKSKSKWNKANNRILP